MALLFLLLYRHGKRALQRKTYQQARLFEIARELAGSLDIQQVLHQIATGAHEILEVTGCIIYMLSEDGRKLHPVVAVEPEYEQEVLEAVLDVEGSLTGQAVKNRRSLIFNDVQASGLGVQVPGTPVILDERVMVAPFITGDQVMGAMCLNRIGRLFSEEDLALAETFAAYASTALKNAGAHDELQKKVVEQQQAEQELRESERRYRALMEQSVEAIYLSDAQTMEVLEANPAFLHLLGYSREEATRLKAPDILAPDILAPDILAPDILAPAGQKVDRQQQILSAQRLLSGERVWRRKDGGLVNVEVTASRITLGGKEMVLAMARDIGERLQRQREQDAILSLASALRSARTRADMLPVIAAQVSGLLQAQSVALCMRDPASGETVFELATGTAAKLTGRRLPPGQGIGGRVLQTGLPYISHDVSNDPHLILAEPGAAPQTLAAVPLIAQDGPVGSLSVGRDTPVSDAELRLLLALGEIAANAIQREGLHEQTRQYAARMAVVSSTGRSLAETLEPAEIYARLAQGVHQLLPEIGTLFISRFDPQREMIQAVYGVQDGEVLDVTALPEIPLAPPGEGTQSEVIRTRQPLVVENLAATLRTKVVVGTTEPETQSALYVPLLAKGQILGVFQVQSYRAKRFGQTDAELLSIMGNTAAIAMQNARLFEETQRRVQRLDALHSIDRTIATNFNLELILRAVLEQAMAQLGVHAACILLFNAPSRMLMFEAGCGFRREPGRRAALPLADGRSGRVAQEREILVENLGGSDQRSAVSGQQAAVIDVCTEGFVSYVGTPLVAKGKLKGVLELYHREPLQPDQEWLNFLDALAHQTAIAIDNAWLFDDLQRSNFELTLAYDTTLEGWARALELRDKETQGHSQRVTELTVQLARDLGMPDEALVHVRRGAVLHDIGKMGIPDSILLKPGKLNEDEWAVMRQHPALSFNLLSRIPFLHPALDIPYCHHERWDGSGYPRGLKGEQIPFSARIFSIVDVWDALLSDRPYRPAWPEEQALEHIREQAGKHFDPRVVEAFFKHVTRSTCNVKRF